MTILNFVSQDELDDLDDDPRIAFMTLVYHAQRSLAEQTKRLDPQDESQWEQREELRHSFMNVVIAAAKRFQIEPFVSMEVPRLSDFKQNVDYRQFKADLDHYITQLVIDNSIRAKQDSVAILPNSKDRIRRYVHGLRQCIERANMTEPKREALLKKLDQFEAELEKRRLNILAVARVAFELLALRPKSRTNSSLTSCRPLLRRSRRSRKLGNSLRPRHQKHYRLPAPKNPSPSPSPASAAAPPTS